MSAWDLPKSVETRIPETIRQYRPGSCTEIKLINGHYYVYMYSACRLPSGNWGRKLGKSIGKTVDGVGFIPYKNFPLYKNEDKAVILDDAITVLE